MLKATHEEPRKPINKPHYGVLHGLKLSHQPRHNGLEGLRVCIHPAPLSNLKSYHLFRQKCTRCSFFYTARMPAPSEPSGPSLSRQATNEPVDPGPDGPHASTAVPHPGTIKINVQGAFIVDDESHSPVLNTQEDEISYQHDTKDIRLPNHTAVVSHVAVDVSA